MINRIVLGLIAVNILLCAAIAWATFDGQMVSAVGWVEALIGWLALASCKTNEIVSNQ